MNKLVKLRANQQLTVLLFAIQNVIRPSKLDVYRASPHLYTGNRMIKIDDACQGCSVQVSGGVL